MKRSRSALIRTLSAIVCSFLVIQSAPLYANHQLPHQNGRSIIKQINKIQEKLNLSPEQTSALKIIQAKSHVFMKIRQKELKNIYEEADKLAQNKAVDKLKLDRLADKRCKLSQQTIKHHVLLKHEIYHILDMKQRQKLQEEMPRLNPRHS